MSFEVTLEQFSGPLQLLLNIIDDKKLPITDVSLAAIAEDYLAYLENNEVAPEELADFLVVATRLLYLKSREILPLPEEEIEEASSLADQLKMYEQFVEASKHIEVLYHAEAMSFPRQKIKFAVEEGFSPPEGVGVSEMKASFDVLLKRLEPFFALRRVSLQRVVSVKERLKQIHDVIKTRSRMTFKDVIGGASKVDVVVSFLALLELLRDRTASAVQKDAFDDIVIKHND
jgi:segregation and condensation protein A